MSSVNPPNPPPNPPASDPAKPEENATASQQQPPVEDAPMDTTPDAPPEENWDDIPEDVFISPVEDILTRVRLIENDIKVMRSETLRLQHEQSTMREKIRETAEKVKQNKVLPYLVANVVEVCNISVEPIFVAHFCSY
jgi:26S proteasome regulatory subunit T5